jgi:phosphomannomutase / phosphoglucomutase
VVGDLYTPTFVAEIASAYGAWLGAPGSVLIGQDFRTTSPGISQILAGALQMLGFDVVEVGPMPTPCFQFNIQAFGAKGGLMVTASHNPPEFNGIKFTGPRGLGIPPEAELKIEQVLARRDFARSDWMTAGTIRSDSTGIDRYLTSIQHHVDATAIRRAQLKVVLDPGNGTSATTSPKLLRDLGCSFVSVNSNPDGWFPGRLSEPSHENLTLLEKTVPKSGAALGIAHDGDADRVAFVDERGKYLTGDVTLTLLARYVLHRYPGGTIVTSVTTSTVLQDVVERAGGKLVVTKSGALPVATAIEKTQAVFGGEENGHCYWPEHQNSPDGPMTSAVMLELLAHEGRTLSELVAEIPAYHLRKQNLRIESELKAPVMDRALQVLRGTADRIDTTDGVKAYFPEGWLLISPSVNEPTIEVFAEGNSPARATLYAEKGLGVVREALAAVPPAAGGAVGS